ncbi:MAG: hypothetical protein K2N43_07255 [Lachnospiraceae bacterium]|nr:hypothetical protein [Lachnospiraceae bacterium]
MGCKIRAVDYDATLRNLYPRILEESGPEMKGHLLFRLLEGLGDDGERILARLASFVNEEDKRYILYWYMKVYSSKLTELVNRKLQESDIGRCFSIGTLTPDLEDTSIVFYAQNTTMDYPAFMELLMQHTPGGFLGQPLLRLVNSAIKGGDTDQKIIKAAGNPIVQAMITHTLSSALRKQAICVELDGISIRLAENSPHQPAADTPLSDQRIESILMEALVVYLRQTVPEDNTSVNAAAQTH